MLYTLTFKIWYMGTCQDTGNSGPYFGSYSIIYCVGALRASHYVHTYLCHGLNEVTSQIPVLNQIDTS
jgi:hypothetical protein